MPLPPNRTGDAPAPVSRVTIHFVEFHQADFLRHRLVWDHALSGSPFHSTTGVACGLALAKSRVYRDPCGRLLRDQNHGALPLAGTTAMVNNKSGATLPSPPPADALAGLAALRNATGAP